MQDCQCRVRFHYFTHCSCSFYSNLIVCHSLFLFSSFSSSFLTHFPSPVFSMLCLLSAFHSWLLFLHLRYYCLSCILHSFFCFSFSFLSSSHLKSSTFKEVFIFRIKLNVFAPSSSMLLSVDHVSFSFLLLFIVTSLTSKVEFCEGCVRFQCFVKKQSFFPIEFHPCSSFCFFSVYMFLSTW